MRGRLESSGLIGQWRILPSGRKPFYFNTGEAKPAGNAYGMDVKSVKLSEWLTALTIFMIVAQESEIPDASKRE